MKTIKIIPSKSDAHRAYIATALSGADFSRVVCGETSEDIEATKRCLTAILQEVNLNEEGDTGCVELYCGESGSTLRFLLPVVGAFGIKSAFHPEGRLPERPLSPFREELVAHGLSISEQGSTPLVVSGKLNSGIYRLPGNVSSQFISGLLFALPILKEDSEIYVEGELESSPYVDMTVETLGRFGIEVVDETDMRFVGSDFSQSRTFRIKGNQRYKAPDKYVVEGDWSNAAFWLAMGAIGNEPIRVDGLRIGSMQGDERVLDALDVFGARFEVGEDRKSRIEGSNCYAIAYPSKERMQGITWDASETPDMVPAIALMGAFAKGETRIVNAGRLRLKESDRLHTVAETLGALGVEVEELEDGLIVSGLSSDNTVGHTVLEEATLDSYGDHRIVMMAAAASVSMADTEKKIKLIGYDAVKKSYPAFFDIMKELELDTNLELI